MVQIWIGLRLPQGCHRGQIWVGLRLPQGYHRGQIWVGLRLPQGSDMDRFEATPGNRYG